MKRSGRLHCERGHSGCPHQHAPRLGLRVLLHLPGSAAPKTRDPSVQCGLRWMLHRAVAPTDLQHPPTICDFTGHTVNGPGRPIMLCCHSYGEQRLDAPSSTKCGHRHHQVKHCGRNVGLGLGKPCRDFMGCAADKAANTLKSAPTCCFHSCSMLLSKSLIFRLAMPAYLPGCRGD